MLRRVRPSYNYLWPDRMDGVGKDARMLSKVLTCPVPNATAKWWEAQMHDDHEGMNDSRLPIPYFFFGFFLFLTKANYVLRI